MSTQLAPAELQRRHWSVRLGAGEPLHCPFVAVSVAPTCARPLIAGGWVLTGGVDVFVAAVLKWWTCTSHRPTVSVNEPRATLTDRVSVATVALGHHVGSLL